MKAMLNWDLFTHSSSEIFALNTSQKEKIDLSKEWQSYMNKRDMFISFYQWKRFSNLLKPRNFSKSFVKPCSTKPICCSVQTISISELGKEIGKLKKSIKDQENRIEQKEE